MNAVCPHCKTLVSARGTCDCGATADPAGPEPDGIRETRTRYGVDYTTNILDNPEFADIPFGQRVTYLKDHKRTTPQGDVTIGGCGTWTREGFIATIRGEMELAEAWHAVLSEDNFVSRAFGIF